MACKICRDYSGASSLCEFHVSEQFREAELTELREKVTAQDKALDECREKLARAEAETAHVKQTTKELIDLHERTWLDRLASAERVVDAARECAEERQRTLSIRASSKLFMRIEDALRDYDAGGA